MGLRLPHRTIDQIGWESHIQTFLGWRLLQTPANQIPQPLGGPENSLTVWDDQGGLETLSDYGAVWTFMEFLADRYGEGVMTALHNGDENGLPGLQAVLDRFVTGKTTQELIHEWAAMVALDASIDDGANLRGRQDKADYEVGSLHSSIYWVTRRRTRASAHRRTAPTTSSCAMLAATRSARPRSNRSRSRGHGSTRCCP